MSWTKTNAKGYLLRKSEGSPGSNRLHYCRDCEAVFPPGETELAHTSALIHAIATHHATREFRRCSRYCIEIEQPEERTAERKLYGVGYEKHTSPYASGYKDLFPDEME